MNNAFSQCYFCKTGRLLTPIHLMDAFYCLKYALVLFAWFLIVLPQYTTATVNLDLYQYWQSPSASKEGQASSIDDSDYIQLPTVDDYQKLEIHDSFSSIKSQFLSDINTLKELADRFVGKKYDDNIDVFYSNIDNPPEYFQNYLLALYKYTRFHIHHMVKQLEHKQNTNLGEVDQKSYIASVLHLCLNDMDLCPAAIHTRFTHSFMDIEASQTGLPGHIFKVRMTLFRQFIELFMFNEQRSGRLNIPPIMEIHWYNYLYNLFCEKLKLPLIQDQLAEQYAVQNKEADIRKNFLLAAPLFINSRTILQKLAAGWSDHLKALFKEQDILIWKTCVIDSHQPVSDISSLMDSKIFLLVNNWLKTTKENELNFNKIVDEIDFVSYSFRRYQEKVLAWVTNYFYASKANVFTNILNTPERNLHIGTVGNIFFWVFAHQEYLKAGQECTFDTDNHITLKLSHLTLIDLFSQPDATYALLTQALEQTDSPEDISSFFLDPKISEQLCKLQPMVMQALSNQLTDKLASNDPDFETTLLQCICNKLNCSYNKIIYPDTLGWLIGTSLLEPVLLELQKREIDISLVTQSLFSWDISSFSEESTKQLLTPVHCQRLLQQACTLNQVESAYKLLVTGNCDNCTNSLNNTQENLLSIFARSGFLPGLKYLLERDITSLNSQDVNGNTALAKATIQGHTACVKLLLAKKVMTNLKDNLGASPLHHASSGNVECLQMLIDDGANVNEKDNLGCTPLHNAAYSGNAECIIALLAIRGIKVNEQAHGWTPLHYAVNCNNVECARALLNAKDILVNKQNNRGNTALHLAAQHDHSECLSLLTGVKHIDVNQQNNDAWTPMAIAISSNFKASFEILLAANGIQINTHGNSGRSPLHFAAQLPDTAIINMLLAEDQIQVNIKSDYGLTPLHSAAAFGKVENVKVLLQIDGIQINIRNNDGYTPLICAAICGHLACMEALLATNSIKVNKACFDARATALIYAITNKHQDCAKHLINDRRINLTKKSRSLGTPLIQAKAHSLTDIIGLIEDKKRLNTCMGLFNKILKFR
ncbi:MAG: ankyrin repeat domain-containing protein [Candidatus Endonucleobacter sp. (ex Gigantidas childressi)]|nr:ankyrin repeat domain-containing protein [Candidatus Endonucleobacter sp. (ex Gigantidas childressi)]